MRFVQHFSGLRENIQAKTQSAGRDCTIFLAQDAAGGGNFIPPGPSTAKPDGDEIRIMPMAARITVRRRRETRNMKRMLAALTLLPVLLAVPAQGADADISAAQSTIDAQIKAFLANDDAKAYSYAAPGIKNMFPTVEAFMGMVERAYQPVWHPKSYAFGKAEESGGTSVTQHVLVTGPDGKSYEAVYTLERQPDGVFRITGVSLRASNTLST
jgi:hypothetical protein